MPVSSITARARRENFSLSASTRTLSSRTTAYPSVSMVAMPNRCHESSSRAIEPCDNAYLENTLINTTTSAPIHSQELRRPTATTRRSSRHDRALAGSPSSPATPGELPGGVLESVTITSIVSDAGKGELQAAPGHLQQSSADQSYW